MAGMLRVPRSRGAFGGALLIILGIWGGLIPLVGPYVHYAYTPDRAWALTSGRIWLEIVPAAGALIGGIVLLLSRLRPIAMFGAWLALLSGGWFAFGSALAPLWTKVLPAQGTPVGGHVAQAVEQIGFFTGLGAVIVCVASLALGRLSVVSARDIRIAGRVASDRASAAPADAPTATASSAPSTSFPSPSGSAPATTMTRVLSRSKSGSDSGDGGSAL